MISLYNMVSGELNFKINKSFDPLIWSSVVRYFYTRKGYNIGELNEDQEQAWKARKRRGILPFSLLGFQF